MDTATTPDRSFAQIQFGGMQLGDKRLDRRLVESVDQLVRTSEVSLPDKFHDPKGYRGFLRLMADPRVTADRLLQHHAGVVRERLRKRTAPVLIVHDTTELDYSGHHALTGIGPIGNGRGRGFECHNSLAIDPDTREIFGLLSQILHVRPESAAIPKGVAAKRADPHRESRLWQRGVEACGPDPVGAHWVHVCDRGADVFEFLAYMRGNGSHFVVRSTYNRILEVDEEDGGPPLLHDRLRTVPAQACWRVSVPARDKCPAREAKVHVRFATVNLKPPHVQRGEYERKSLRVGAVLVEEIDPPAGAEAIEWVLLTEGALETTADAVRMVDWYKVRWVVEEYHKGQKTGAGIEALQIESVHSLKPAIALLSVVAIVLLNLRILYRDETTREEPAKRWVDPLWIVVLSRWRFQDERELTVGEFTLALARLGGHQNRKSDGAPGWLTLWRGWKKLHIMIEYELSTPRCGQ